MAAQIQLEESPGDVKSTSTTVATSVYDQIRLDILTGDLRPGVKLRSEYLRERYQVWLQERDADNAFTPEQREWLDRMAEHIATSLAIEPEDFETGWFGQHGSLGRAHGLFGNNLKPLMAELNDTLAA